MEAWITEEFGEKRLLFKKEDKEKLENIIMNCYVHVNLYSEASSEFCWVHEYDIALIIYAISCYYSVTIM